MTELAKKLKNMRESMRPVRNVTVTSQLMGLPTDALRKYELGKVRPSIKSMELIADYYEIPVSELLKI